MTARSDILSRIRARSGAAVASAGTTECNPNAAAPVPRENLVDRFAERASRESAQVVAAASGSAVPAAVATYLATHQLAPRAALAPDVALLGLDWTAAELEVTVSDPAAATLVTTCRAATADWGVVACTFASSSEPATIYRAETHVVILRRAQVVPTLDDLWERLRSECGDAWPASINLLAGPSRTADIELELQIGVHGPLRMLVVLVD
jgi:L-lactate utilization protein LutC